MVRPTTPLRNVEIIEKAIKNILMDKNADSLRSVHLMSESPYKFYENDKVII